eukprot:TRINITY_DN43934_c0_g1_i1.p1 TRINITY_DN43934_c0_g1~~TRINITY_DN43934_c0_g1_i1.p1  ORF type:complete len:350 (+),score=117.85 TRINITY_DN43934_c0_g1_i1:68-1117(+)
MGWRCWGAVGVLALAASAAGAGDEERPAAAAPDPNDGVPHYLDVGAGQNAAERNEARRKYRDTWTRKLVTHAMRLGPEEEKRVRAELRTIWSEDDEFRTARDAIRADYKSGKIGKDEYKEKVQALVRHDKAKLSALRARLRKKELERGTGSDSGASSSSSKSERYHRMASRWRRKMLRAAADKGMDMAALTNLQKEIDALLEEQQKLVDESLAAKATPGTEERALRRARLRALNARRREMEEEISGVKPARTSFDKKHEKRLTATRVSLVSWRRKVMTKAELAGLSRERMEKLEMEVDAAIQAELRVFEQKHLWPEPSDPKTPEQRLSLRKQLRELKERRTAIYDSIQG